MDDDWSELLLMAQLEVNALLSSLPRPVRQKALTIPVSFEPRPAPELVEDGLAEDTLGLFVGSDLADEEQDVMPPQIILYLENIREFCEGDEEACRQEIRTTLLHELGHYLGMDETDLFDRGLD